MSEPIVETPTNVPARPAVGMRGNKKLPKGARPKRTVELEFRPNSFQPVIELNAFRAPTVAHEFDHVPDGFELLATNAASLLSNVAHQRFPTAYPQVLIDEANVRMGHLIIAKKLTYAVEPDVANIHYDDFKVVKNASLKVPNFASVLADGYGVFENEGVTYRPRDHALHFFNHFARACHDPGRDGGPIPAVNPPFMVNVAMSDWWSLLRSFLVNRVEGWLEKQPNVNVIVNTVQYSVPPPSPRHTIPLPVTAAADLTAGGLVLPPGVISDLDLIASIDTTAHAVGIIPPALGLFGAANIRLLNWNAHTAGQRLNHYIRNFESKFSTVWATVYTTSDTVKMEDKGKPWQLADMSESLMSSAPLSLAKTELAIAHMLGSRERRVSFARGQIMSTAAVKTPSQMQMEVLRKGMKVTDFA